MSTLTALALATVACALALFVGGSWLVIRTLRRLRSRLAGRLAALGTLAQTAAQRARPESSASTPLPSRQRRPPRLPSRPRSGLSTPKPLAPAPSLCLQAWLPGRSRAVAAVRRDLHRDVRSANQAVRSGLEAGRPVQSLAAIAARLQRSAVGLDTDLAVIAAEPDGAERSQLLRQQHERIETVRRACQQLRRGVLLAGSATTGPLLPTVVDDLNDEVIRLGLWAAAHRELNGR